MDQIQPILTTENQEWQSSPANKYGKCAKPKS